MCVGWGYRSIAIFYVPIYCFDVQFVSDRSAFICAQVDASCALRYTVGVVVDALLWRVVIDGRWMFVHS